VQITLDAAQVSDHQVLSKQREEYERIAPRYPDTVSGQWKLAQWCRENKLKPEQQMVLERILELDPDHSEARRLLGYSESDGEWTTQAQRMARDGYERYRGGWWTPQEIEVYEQRKEFEQGEIQWRKKLKLLRALITRGETRLAREKFAAIKDVHALGPLKQLLKKDPPGYREIYMLALGAIGTPAARDELVQRALLDQDQEVRYTCIEELVRIGGGVGANVFINALDNPNNAMVRRAAVALGELKVPEATGPLIDALITTHKIVYEDPDQANTQASFGSGPGGSGGSFSSGKRPPSVKILQVRNQEVLDALEEISGHAGFGFDVDSWYRWHGSHGPGVAFLDLRRD